jgi:hypothetical protein
MRYSIGALFVEAQVYPNSEEFQCGGVVSVFDPGWILNTRPHAANSSTGIGNALTEHVGQRRVAVKVRPWAWLVVAWTRVLPGTRHTVIPSSAESSLGRTP